ncbi:MAG: maleylpyruvate isomerase N-terminal domain-containing protein, partial [Nocardioidaceae bacterium]
MDLTTLHRRSIETWTDRLARVRPDQWDAPTPCTEWSVRDLVNHVVGEDRWTVPLMHGSTISDVGA